jgi:hypothetical protein
MFHEMMKSGYGRIFSLHDTEQRLISNLLFLTLPVMDTWNEKTVKRQIDEIITESYLLCLCEREVRSYLKHFLDTCEAVIEASDGGSRDLRFATVRIAMLKAYLLLNADSLTVAGQSKRVAADGGDYDADLRRFVEQVVSARSLIL